MNRTSAMLTLMIPAAPKPWMMRAKVRVGSESESAQPSEAKVKMANPHL